MLAKIDDLVEQNKAFTSRTRRCQRGSASCWPALPNSRDEPASRRRRRRTRRQLPPSSGRKANVANASTTKKGRKGHPGVTRELCANPDVTRDVRVERCTCGAKLPATEQVLARGRGSTCTAPIAPAAARPPPPSRPQTCRPAPLSAPASSRSSHIFTAARWSATRAWPRCRRSVRFENFRRRDRQHARTRGRVRANHR